MLRMHVVLQCQFISNPHKKLASRCMVAAISDFWGLCKKYRARAPTLFAQGRRLQNYQCQRMVHEGRAIVRRHLCVSGVRVPGKVVDNPWGRSLRPKCLRPANSRHRPDTEAASGARGADLQRIRPMEFSLRCPRLLGLIAAE